jgi:hypothetical protein
LADSFVGEPPPLLCGRDRLLDEHSAHHRETNALAAEDFRMGESSPVFASPPQLALNLDNLQKILDRTHSRMMIGKMSAFGVTAGRAR